MSRTSKLSGRIVRWTGLDESGTAILEAFTEHGATVERDPLLRCVLNAAVDVFASVRHNTWLVFTSARAVDAIAERPLPEVKIAVVGPASADRLRTLGREPDLVPEMQNAEGLAAALVRTVTPGHVLFLRGNKTLPTLRSKLSAAGFDVEEREVYRTEPVSKAEAAAVAKRIEMTAGIVLFGSPEGVRALSAAVSLQNLAQEKPGLLFCALGKTTAAALSACGIPHPVVAPGPAPEDVIRAVDAAC